jgi:hypothetical protein
MSQLVFQNLGRALRKPYLFQLRLNSQISNNVELNKKRKKENRKGTTNIFFSTWFLTIFFYCPPKLGYSGF